MNLIVQYSTYCALFIESLTFESVSRGLQPRPERELCPHERVVTTSKTTKLTH